jgi:hypothetical protein
VVSFCVVLALLRISSAHFSAPLLRDVGTENIEQLEERWYCRPDSELSIVDFDEIYDEPGIVFLPADTQRGEWPAWARRKMRSYFLKRLQPIGSKR